MTSLQVKGHFEVISNDNQQIAIGVAHNGMPAYLAATPLEAIIRQRNVAGSVVAEDMAGVPQEIINLMMANDDIYERRRIAWVKLTFIPKYTSYIQSLSDGSGGQIISSVPNEIVYVAHDSNGLNGTGVDSNMLPLNLLANNTGVKLKKLNRTFKVFRKSHKYPFAPKYVMPSGELSTNSVAEIRPSGLWVESIDTTRNTNHDHTMIVTEPGLAFATGTPLFTCVHEIKYVWADRKTAVTPQT